MTRLSAIRRSVRYTDRSATTRMHVVILAVVVLAGACGGTTASGTPASWHRIALDDPDGAAATAVALGGPGYVAVGGTFGPTVQPAVWTSSDALTWTRLPNVGPLRSGRIDAVASTDHGLVAVGTDNQRAAAWTSADGLAWTRAPDAEALGPETAGAMAQMQAVAVANGRIVAVGLEFGAAQRGLVWTSSDGLAWSRVGLLPDSEDGIVTTVVAGGPGFVAAGAINGQPELAAIWTSADGSNWARVPNTPAFQGSAIFDLTRGGPGLVAVGNTWDATGGHASPAAWTSTDGLAWTRVPDSPAFADQTSAGPSGGNLHGALMSNVVATGPGLVAVGSEFGLVSDPSTSRGAIWTSSDGTAWTRAADQALFAGGHVASGIVMARAVGGPALVILGSTADAAAVAWVETGATAP